MRALITGGAGFVGSHLADALLNTGAEVDVVDDLSTGRRENLTEALGRGARLHVADVTDALGLADLARAARPDVVFHLAAMVDVPSSVLRPDVDATINVAGTASALEAARSAGATRFVLASTSAVYGDPPALPVTEQEPLKPLSPYGAGKAAAESYLALYGRLHGLSTVALRLGNVYGPRQDPHGESGVIAIFCAAAAEGRRATVYGDGRQTRDYVYVADVAEAFAAAAQADATGAVNVASGTETTVLELTEALRLPYHHAPPRPGDIERSALDPERARAELAWTAHTKLEEGLEQTLRAAPR